MGCWNQTCGLTQLHIRAGQKVMVVPLTQSLRDSLCYTTPFYTPFPVPFYAEYNDYGAGENETGVGMRLAMEHIKDQLVEVEQGENQYHDIPVKKEGFSIELFWEACHENRLHVKSVFQRDKSPQEVGFVMIHMGIFEYLAEHYEFSDSDYDRHTGNIEYFKYKLQDILNGVPAFVDAIMEPDEKLEKIREHLVDSGKSEEEIAEFMDDFQFMMRGVCRVASVMRTRPGQGVSYQNQLTNKEGFNRAADWMQHYPSHMSYSAFGAHQLDEWCRQLVKAGDRDGLIEMFSEYIRLMFIDTIMLHTRKFWSPQAGAGSQQEEADGYLKLNAAIEHILAEEKAEWEDDEDEFEDDDTEAPDEV